MPEFFGRNKKSPRERQLDDLARRYKQNNPRRSIDNRSLLDKARGKPIPKRPTYNAYDYYSGGDYHSVFDSPVSREKKRKKNPVLRLKMVMYVAMVGATTAAAAFGISRLVNPGEAEASATQPPQVPSLTYEPTQQPTATQEPIIFPPPRQESTAVPTTTQPTQEVPGSIPTRAPTESLQVSPTPEVIRDAHIKVELSDFGLPTAYELNDGTRHEFTVEEQAEFARIRQQAINDQVPKIAEVIFFPDNGPQYQETVDRPFIREVPTDAMTETELEEKGIKIIQADNTQFYIRSSAFEPGTVLSRLAALQKTAHPVDLTIVFVDAPVLSQNALKDSRYNEVRDILDPVTIEDVETYRQRKITEISDNIEWMVQANLMDEPSRILFELEIEEWKMKPADQIEMELLAPQTDHAGFFHFPDRLDANGHYPATIFVATGTVPQLPDDKAAIYFDSQGQAKIKESIVHMQVTDTPDNRPSSERSFPRPSDYRLRTNASEQRNEYPYGSQLNPGQSLRHELNHLDMIVLKPLLGTGEADLNEYRTDMAAMEEFRDAYDTWESSNYQDDSDYGFVFKVQDGEYMLTGDQENSLPTNSAPFESV